jgi:hypothetical protein
MITEKDKTQLLDILKQIDVKDMTIEHDNPLLVKWFRFGNYNALKIVSELIKAIPTKKIKDKPLV